MKNRRRWWQTQLWQSCCLVVFVVTFLAGGWVLSLRPETRLTAAEECTCSPDVNEIECNKVKQACWQTKISQKQQEANTLASVISVLNGQIKVQELQINQTELEIEQLLTEISDLNNRISGLNISLDRLTDNLIERVNASYKRRTANPVEILVVSDSLSSFMTKYKYLQIAQKHTQEVMHQAETQRIDFDAQKQLKEKKQAEVDQKRAKLQQQQNAITKQRAEQQVLLQQTRNDEARYQQELARTLAEGQAIQAVIAGNGNESKVKDVTQGETVATIISGASPCSNGTHLHFEVVKDGQNRNPAEFLKAINTLSWNNSPDDAFGFSGSWDWPVHDPAKINQGYGMTWYARVRRAYGGNPHTGIDMMSRNNDMTVRAVRDGTLYRGSIACGKGYLRYVKVQHKDDGYSTYYLHVNY